MIAKLKAFGAFWYDFLVGDDWRIALGVVVSLAATYVVSLSHVAAWWLLPVALVVFLPLSLWRAARRSPVSAGEVDVLGCLHQVVGPERDGQSG